MCARLAEFFCTHSLGSLWKAQNFRPGGSGYAGNKYFFVRKKLFIVFILNNVSGCVEGITLRLCLVLLVVVILA